ncbi:hydroxymethylglutaryl-CoA lyase [Nocardioides sp. zg-ZUI104]|nr:hydroxymethylglutaryl-CoA lyase [Nocardioides faecalis]
MGPRDGLQNERRVLGHQTRAELVRRLAAAGLREIEVGSMVRPDLVPQLADTDRVLADVADLSLDRSIVLVPNRRGLERALEAGAPAVAVFAAASDTFNRRNIGRSTEDALAEFAAVAAAALAAGVPVRGYASTIFGCPFEGAVTSAQVVPLVEAMLEMGCYEVSLGDTIGVGTPEQTHLLVEDVARAVGLERIAVHMHDTQGRGLINTLTALDLGVPAADTSVGGLGGCPFAGEGATGNLATESLVAALAQRGQAVDVDLAALTDTADWILRELAHDPT